MLQIVAIVACILAHRWDHWQMGWYPFPVHLTAVIATYWMAIVSVISAVDYFAAFWKKVDVVSDRRRKKRVLSRKKRAAQRAVDAVDQQIR